jgi:NAD(P)-dependent dehydrogenase (short-subunit alcohol dehydrogenase family)
MAISLVTGAASGIGAALVRELLRAGDTVIATDVNESAGAALVDALKGQPVSFKRLDVRDLAAFRAVVAQVVTEHGRLDRLFNNAGVVIFKTAVAHTDADWDLTLDVNLKGAVNGCRAGLEVMTKQRSGHLVNVASIAGLAPLAEYPVYGITKFGIVGLSLNLRSELAAHGVHVTAVCPGGIRTAMTAPLVADLDQKSPGLGAKVIPGPDELARYVVGQLRKHPAIVIYPRWYRLVWWLWRLFPSAFLRSQRRSA